MRTHKLKTWPEFFADLAAGKKTFELRNDDRRFEVGDRLLLQEYDPATKTYSGREIERTVSHILAYEPDKNCAATFGLKPGFVVMSLKR